MITKNENDTRLSVFVQTNASKSEIIGPHNGALKIKIHSPPIDGKANEELIRFLSKTLDHATKNINILKGGTGRKKTVQIAGLSLEIIKQRLGI